MKKRIKLTIPTSMEEVTLEQYQKWAVVANQNEDGMFLMQKTVEIFCGIPLSVVAEMTKRQLDRVVESLMLMVQEPRKGLVYTFKVDGKKYGFMPKLEDMTAGEWVDLEMYIKDWSNMHKAMSVLYRPVVIDLKDRYEIEPYKGSTDIMKHMPASIALDALFFLISLLRILEGDLERYLQKKEIQAKLKPILVQNGVGSMPSMHSLSTILLRWMLLPDQTLRTFSPS